MQHSAARHADIEARIAAATTAAETARAARVKAARLLQSAKDLLSRAESGASRALVDQELAVLRQQRAGAA